jgi:hypothetical protein
MTSKPFYPLALSALAIAAACGPSISSDRDASIPIPVGATFALVGGANVGEERDATLQSQITHQKIQSAIKAEMTSKGFKEAPEGQAAFKVRYFISVQTSTSYVTTGGYGYGYGWGWGGGMSTTMPVTSKEGGAVIDLLTMSDKLAWRGIMKGTAGDKAPSQEKVDHAVKTIMATLKPGS